MEMEKMQPQDQSDAAVADESNDQTMISEEHDRLQHGNNQNGDPHRERLEAQLKAIKEKHQKEMDALKKENAQLKAQIGMEQSLYALLNVLRENGDTIIVAEREANLISKGMKELYERSVAVYLHLSTIAKDFCQKLDDLQAGIEKKEVNYVRASLPLEDFAEENDLVEKLLETERRLYESEARYAHLQESFEDRLNQTNSELGQGDISVFAPSMPDTNQIVTALHQETALIRKDYSKRMIILQVRQGTIKPEEGFQQLLDAEALDDMTLDDLKVMTPKKKHSLVHRVFSSKK